LNWDQNVRLPSYSSRLLLINLPSLVSRRIILGIIFIPVTRRVKGYTRFVGKYVTGRRKRFRPHKVYIYIRL